jgi:hypothetical protein
MSRCVSNLTLEKISRHIDLLTWATASRFGQFVTAEHLEWQHGRGA